MQEKAPPMVGTVGGAPSTLDSRVNGKKTGYKELFCHKAVKHFKVLSLVTF